MIEPLFCVPMAAVTCPTATAAADPDDDPPGVCAGSHGLRVLAGSKKANGVVTVLPKTNAPAALSRVTHVASRGGRWPSNMGEPIVVGRSAVSMMSLTP